MDSEIAVLQSWAGAVCVAGCPGLGDRGEEQHPVGDWGLAMLGGQRVLEMPRSGRMDTLTQRSLLQ